MRAKPPISRLFRLLAACATVGALTACEEGGGATAGGQAPPPPPVDVAAPLIKPIVEWDEYTGQFEATESVEIRARVSGYLESIHFTDGQIVEKDQLLRKSRNQIRQ